MITRPIEELDVNAWAAMRAQLWPDADLPTLQVEAHAFFTDDAETILAAAFMALDDDARPIGFVELAIRAFSDGCDSMPVPHVEGWFVEPSSRGRGVGRALMQAAEDWARARGYTELASDTEVHNVSSLRAHEACGFAEVDRLIKFRKALTA